MKARNTGCILTAICLTAAAPHAETMVWKTMKVGGAGFVSGLVASRTERDLLYARTDVGGAYRWSESTGEWISITDWSLDPGDQGVSSLALDPQDPARVYMITGISYFNGGRTAFLRSTNRGETFEKVDVTALFKVNGNGVGRHLGERLAVDPNLPTRLLAGAGNSANGLFQTADRGTTWTRVIGVDSANVSFIAFDSSSSARGSATRIVYVGLARTGLRNLLRSEDAGATWIPVVGMDTLVPQRGLVTEDGTLHVTFASSPNLSDTRFGSVWKRTRAGIATDITPNARYSAFGGLHAMPGNPRRLIVSTINNYSNPQCWESRPCGWGTAAWGDAFFTTEDGGATWRNQSNGIGNSKTVRLVSESDGPKWAEAANANMHWTGSIVFDPFRPERAFVTSGNGVFATRTLTDTARTTWTFASKGIEEMVTNRMVVLPGSAIVTTIWDYTGFRNASVATYPPWPHRGGSGGRNIALSVARARPQYLVRFGSGDKDSIAISRDSAHTWKLVARPVAVAGGDAILNADGSVLLWSQGTDLHRSTDLGATWTRASWPGPPNPEIHGDPLDPRLFYSYHSSTGNVFVSLDSGATFSLKGTLHAGASANGPEPVIGRVGEFWIPTNGGKASDNWSRRLVHGRIDPKTGDASIVRSIDKSSGLETCNIVGVGKAAPGRSHPSLFVWGRVAGVTGIYRSDDTGASWMRVNDDRHQYGGPGNGQFVQGDPYIHGRVYMGTFGRGVVYGDLIRPVATEPTPPVITKPSLSRLVPKGRGTWSIEYDGSDPVEIAEVGLDGRRASLFRCQGPCTRSVYPASPGRGWLVVRSAQAQEVHPFVAFRAERE